MKREITENSGPRASDYANVVATNTSTKGMCNRSSSSSSSVLHRTWPCAFINWTVHDGRTALYTAAFNGEVEIAALLLAAGADTSLAMKMGTTPLMCAMEGATKRDAEMAALLRATEQSRMFKKLLAASETGNATEVRRVLIAGEDEEDMGRCPFVNRTTGDEGRTCLYTAAFKGHIDVVRVLCEEGGADVEVELADGSRAFDAAAHNGHEEVVEYLRWTCLKYT